jgi:hypothetical protein
MRSILTVCLLSFSIVTLAQVEHDSASIIYAWKLKTNFSRIEEVPVDTSLTNFQIYNPLFKHSVSYSYLGNLGSPGISNVFSERLFSDMPFFLNAFSPYLNTAEATSFYNTKRPFSILSYTYGTGYKEESFEAFHTQNVSPKLNFGFRYQNISSLGQYIYSQVKENKFKLFTSYTGEKYTLHAAFDVNRFKVNENGGISDSVFHSGDYVTTYEIGSFLGGTGINSGYEANVQNRLRYYDLLISQRLKLFTLASKLDTLNKDKGRNIAEPILTYVFNMERGTKTYDDINPMASGFYDSIYFNSSKTLDSLACFRVRNMLQLEFKTTFRRKVQTGIFGLIGSDYEKYADYSLWNSDTGVKLDTLRNLYIINDDTLKGASFNKKTSNTFVSAGIYGNFWRKVIADFSGLYYLAGYRQNQYKLEGILDTRLTILKRDFEFAITGVLENKKPDYLLDNYYSNHYIWNKVLKYEERYRLSSVIRSPSKNLELKGTYYLLRNFIYFNQAAVPENYQQMLNYFSVEATKTFKLGEVYSENSVVYQVTENQSILPLPQFVLYNSTYLDHTFHFKSTNGELHTILGVDVYYNTLFYGYEYLPELSQFYVQNFKEIGNYPLLNVFLNVKLKSVRFFVKVEHINSSLFEQRYYSTIHYPYNQGLEIRNGKYIGTIWKFGLSWTFYE